jgi:predicted DNA-binding antitoxin AbrB/MazE fold protein
MRLIEARYEDGMLRPTERLALRPGERVNLIVVRRPDPSRWNLSQLAKTADADELALAEEGLADWADTLDAEDRS